MKKIDTIGVIFLVSAILLSSFTGCAQKRDTLTKTVSRTEASRKDTLIELYIKEFVASGKYEPEKGVYLGAYVDKNKDIGGDIAIFEELVGKSQVFKVFQYTMGKGMSSQDILKCMAQNKIPYIKLLLDKSYDLTPLYRMISDIHSSYNLPVFIELFPLTSSLSNPEEYKAIYHRAYQIIDKYLKEAVIVWSVDDTRLYDMPLYYPGDKFADWVGLNLYIPQYKDNKKYAFSGLGSLDFWYKSFQKSKPMMISALAVSHFSQMDHTYYIQDAENKLDLFYKELPVHYPRIKAILYIDVDMGEAVKNGMDDYRITSQKQLSGHMKDLLMKENFLGGIQEEIQEEMPIFMKYDLVAAKFGEELYLSKEYVSSLFKKVPLSKITMLEDLNGKKFYKLRDFKEYVDLYYYENEAKQ